MTATRSLREQRPVIRSLGDAYDEFLRFATLGRHATCRAALDNDRLMVV
jgi:hypothetical protein